MRTSSPSLAATSPNHTAGRHLCNYRLVISPCPASPALLLERSDFFYARPDPAWDGDGGAWFTTTPLERHALESLLARMLLVRDIYTDSQEQAEEEGGAE